MAGWDIFEYLLEGKRRGLGDFELKNHLLRNGFDEDYVEESFFQLNNELRINRKETLPAFGTYSNENFEKLLPNS
ncbi:MAG: hypothetical protein ABEI74_03260 [Candidatus Pacearchaeota archaeon]